MAWSGRSTKMARARGVRSRDWTTALSVAGACSIGLHGAALALSMAWAATPVEASMEDGLVFVSVAQHSPEAPSNTGASADGIRPRPWARKRHAQRTAVRTGQRDRARDPNPRPDDPRPAPALASGAVAPPPRSRATPAPPPAPAPPPVPARPLGEDRSMVAPLSPLPAEIPELISPSVAAALRVQDHFPSLPARLRVRTPSLQVPLKVCVSREGVARAEGVGPDVDREVKQILEQAIAAWRYRPLVSDGQPRPFCHRLSLQYYNR